MTRSLRPEAVADVLDRVARADAAHARAYPGARRGRRPVHTVYVPADRFTAGTAEEYGAEARRLLDAHAPAAADLAQALGVADEGLAAEVGQRVRAKLATEPVEDLRVDFEDGYGQRADAEEDRHAVGAAHALVAAREAGTAPPFVGLRVKSFADGLAARSIATLDRFLTALLDGAGGRLPDGLVITFPKVVTPDHVGAFVDLLERLEPALGLGAGALRFEIQVETTQSVLNHLGEAAPRRLLDAARGRCVGAHFGTFDYTAACGLAPGEQRITHPACDFARHVMQVGFAGTGVALSDGSSNVVPTGDDRAAVHRVWRRHAADVTHSLRHGFWQGWDLHPAQLPSRFAAVYAFALADLEGIVARVRAWATRADAAGVLDEPATVTALLAHLRRAVDSGAADEATVVERAGLDPTAFRAMR